MTSLYHDLRNALQGLKEFLDSNHNAVEPGLRAFASVVPQARHLVKSLAYLLENLQHTLQALEPGALSAPTEIAEFTRQIEQVLHAAGKLLPDGPDTVDDVLSMTRVINDLPALGELRTELGGLIDSILGHLRTLGA